MIQLQELVLKNRSYRRFRQSEPITTDQVKKWIGLARLSASGRNMQPLKYAISTQRPLNDSIFSHLAWAGYLSDWKGPAEGERPAAYIVVLHDTKISGKYYCDDGIAMQSILLGAVNDGYGGCIIGSVNRAAVAQLLGLPPSLEILWIIALGKPAETVVIDEMQGDDIRYWRDENSIHHVPKRSIDELVWPIP
ncbi:MAG: nitroreductase family protein [Prolixibacteraceae bacterium]|jgi:nitroreductase|nr:nitroreductase family protein [Prolixibacteraceae bacterium]MDI9563866.1 nitroreductase family protein [Bacteroidota bacterium]NLS98476.1 nitroreductase family protein [Bacteroidales bacterium]OQB82297.1 MAG: nitroreductase A [Bacteroidetes bacterium ADurb.Bin123]HNU77815.1 nitroreductase family protein [Prolixibacteraceae bacterium]